MARSRDVLCAVHITPVGPFVLAGVLSQRGSMQAIAVMPSAHLQRMHCAGQAYTPVPYDHADILYDALNSGVWPMLQSRQVCMPTL